MAQNFRKIQNKTMMPGFDPEITIREYLAGKYDHLIPGAPKSEIFKGDTVTQEEHSDIHTTPTGHKMIVDTPQIYCYVNEDNRPFHICLWCRRKFTWPFIGEGYDIISVPKKGPGYPDYIIPSKGTFCTFECHNGYIDDRYHGGDSQGINSRNIASSLFGNFYPGQVLLSAPHFSMLDINGGPMDEATFFSNEHRWITSGKFAFKPFGHTYTSI